MPFIWKVCVLFKTRLIFPRINGPNVFSSKLQTCETVKKENVLLTSQTWHPKFSVFSNSFSPSCLFIIFPSNFENTDPHSILLCQHESILKGPGHAICCLFTKLKFAFAKTKFQNNGPVFFN